MKELICASCEEEIKPGDEYIHHTETALDFCSPECITAWDKDFWVEKVNEPKEGD